MIENAVGVFGIPVGIACNFTINGRDVLVPMATEEPSVVAAASSAARIARVHARLLHLEHRSDHAGTGSPHQRPATTS